MTKEIDVNRDELEVVFSGCYCGIVFVIDKVTWEYAIKFKNKITASETNKIKTFIFDKYHLANYEFRPDIAGNAIWFVFNILKDGAFIGY